MQINGARQKFSIPNMKNKPLPCVPNPEQMMEDFLNRPKNDYKLSFDAKEIP